MNLEKGTVAITFLGEGQYRQYKSFYREKSWSAYPGLPFVNSREGLSKMVSMLGHLIPVLICLQLLFEILSVTLLSQIFIF